MEYLLKMIENEMKELEAEKEKFEKAGDDFEIAYHRGQLHSLGNIKAYLNGYLNQLSSISEVDKRIIDLRKVRDLDLLTNFNGEESVLRDLDDTIYKTVLFYSEE